ncbi:MAG: DUF6455 family protein [Pseudomonadota bacterium]
MGKSSRFEFHDQLVSRMAAANGADLDQMTQEGNVSPEDRDAAVVACMGCTDTDGCQAHLRALRSGTPDFCRNRDLMDQWSK